MCVCSPNSSIAVLARFCWSCSDFFHCHFGHPPNMMTFVHPGLKLRAIAVCLNRVCAPSGRVSWRMGRSWLELCDIPHHRSCDQLVGWIYILYNLGRLQSTCITDSSSWIIHLTPSPRVDIKDPCITQSDAIVTNSSSDQQLGMFLAIVEAASCMGVSLRWPRGSLSLLQFGPLLGRVIQ